MVTDLLEVAGLVLLVAAAFVFAGLAAALATAGVCCLAASWAVQRGLARQRTARRR